MSRLDLASLRLFQQQIVSTRCRTPLAVLEWMGAMQAQDYAGSLWSIGLRLPDATESAVEKAVSDRSILRTWPMRGTLHFVPAADARWMLKHLTPRVVAGAARRCRELELHDGVFRQCEKVFARALRGGVQLTREELFEALRRVSIAVDGQRGYHILRRLAQEGLICFAARRGKEHTFALLDEWVPRGRELERDEALAELARRYFKSHGPSSVQDFAWWSGLTVGDARAATEAAAPSIVPCASSDRPYWRAQEPLTRRRVLPGVHLLPGFDEFMLGYQDRSAALDPSHAERIVPGSNGMFLSTVVVNGRVAGTWKKIAKKNSAVLRARPFAPLGKAACRGLAAAAERYGRYLCLPMEIG